MGEFPQDASGLGVYTLGHSGRNFPFWDAAPKSRAPLGGAPAQPVRLGVQTFTNGRAA